jgi:sec-independent protein translocase protein TatB
MFDLSFGEIVVVSAVALIVLGPERLPDAARKLAALIRRVKQEATQMRTHFTKDLNMEAKFLELRQELDALRNQSHSLLTHEKNVLVDTEKSVNQSVEDIQQNISMNMSSIEILPQAFTADATLNSSTQTFTTEISSKIEKAIAEEDVAKSAAPPLSNH